MSRSAQILVLSAGLAACLATPPPKRPKPPAAPPVSAAIGPVVASFLTLDLTREERAALRQGLDTGLQFIAFDGKKVRFLPGCRARGQYGLASKPSERVEVELAERELDTNLPVRGSGTFRRELSGGVAIQVEMMSAGVWASTGGDRPAGPECQGATHWIRRVEFGAFVVRAGVRGKKQSEHAIELLSGGKMESCGVESQKSDCLEPLSLEVVRVGEPLAARGLEMTRELSPPCPEPLARVGRFCLDAQDHPNVRGACDPGSDRACFEACDAGDASSCDALAVGILKRSESEADASWAAKVFAQGCQAGGMSSCTNLALAYLDGFGVVEDPDRAREYAALACDKAFGPGCAVLGVVLQTTRPSESTRAFAKGCEAGSAFACGRLSFHQRVGLETTRDDRKALNSAYRACDGGDGDGCNELGLALEFGRAVPPDPSRAQEFYRKACQTRPDRCTHLAMSLDVGKGGDSQPGEARNLFRRACKSWDVSSCAYLRILGDEEGSTELPRGTLNQQIRRAELGCNAGFERSCTQLGLASLGNRTKAFGYLDNACRLGDTFACHVIDLGGLKPR